MSLLQTVTITGADDDVPHGALRNLSMRYPFIEWGLLMNMRDVRPRYPSGGWLDRVAEQPIRRSLHLCGPAAQLAMSGDSTGAATLALATETWKVRRVQLNGFSRITHLSALRPFLEALGDIECIMQCSGPVPLEGASLLTLPGHNVSALLDASGGRGLPLGELPPLPYGLYVGFAGGITPDNVVATLRRLESLGRPYWIDLETGARDADDRLDLKLVEQILASAEAFTCGAHNG